MVTFACVRVGVYFFPYCITHPLEKPSLHPSGRAIKDEWLIDGSVRYWCEVSSFIDRIHLIAQDFHNRNIQNVNVKASNTEFKFTILCRKRFHLNTILTSWL